MRLRAAAGARERSAVLQHPRLRTEQWGARQCAQRTNAYGILDSYRQAKQQRSSTPVPVDAGRPSEPPQWVLLVDKDSHFTKDDTPCTTDCVLEVHTQEELDSIFSAALPEALVVVDWYKTECVACKYMAPAFQRMCRSASEHAQHIIFVKHNVMDEDDELTPLARRFQIKSVPKFSFHINNGQLVDSFATRDKARLLAAIDKYAPVTVAHWEDEDS